MLGYLKMYAVRLHLQDQENLQGAGEDQGFWVSTMAYALREARKRS